MEAELMAEALFMRQQRRKGLDKGHAMYFSDEDSTNSSRASSAALKAVDYVEKATLLAYDNTITHATMASPEVFAEPRGDESAAEMPMDTEDTDHLQAEYESALAGLLRGDQSYF
jgi:hypothetical protein